MEPELSNKPNAALVSAHLANVLRWMQEEALRASCGQTGHTETITEDCTLTVVAA